MMGTHTMFAPSPGDIGAALRARPGLLLSFLAHALILALPVTVKVQQFPEPRELVMAVEAVPDAPSLREKTAPPPAAPSNPAPSPPKESVPPEPAPVKPDQAERVLMEPVFEEPNLSPPAPRVKPLVEAPREQPVEETGTPDLTDKADIPADVQESLPIQAEPVGPVAPRETAFGDPDAPRFLHQEIPKYPPLARRRGKEGTVLLRLAIDETGTLTGVEIIEDAGYGFSEAAVAAVRRSTFLPARTERGSVPSRALLPIRFTLR